MKHPSDPRLHIDAEKGVIYGVKGSPLNGVHRQGYLLVNTPKGFSAMAHRIIWESVHGAIPDGYEINHINGIKNDNRLVNLEMVTPSQNCVHAYRKGLRVSSKGEKSPSAKLTDSQVSIIRQRVRSGESISAIAKEIGVSRNCVGDANRGRTYSNVSGAIASPEAA